MEKYVEIAHAQKSMISWKKICSWPYLSILLFGFIYFIFHLLIVNDFGDDNVFGSIAAQPGFNIFSYSVERYATWSSRTLIEALMMMTLSIPVIFWKLLDTILMMVIALFISKLLIREEYRLQGNIVVCALLLLIPFSIMSSAGWIATTVNYIWPLAFGLIGLYPLRKIADGKKIKAYEYILYPIFLILGANNEQMCAILLAAYAMFAIFMFVKKKSNVFVLIQLILCVLSIIYVMACPGNESRTVAETTKWYPEFAGFSMLYKVGLGIWAALREIFVIQNLVFLVLTFLVCALVWQKSSKKFDRAVSAIPFGGAVAALAAINVASVNPALSQAVMNGGFIMQFESPKIILLWIGLAVVVCSLLMSICILLGKSQNTLIVLGILILSFGSKAIMGFSPTVWASLQRTGLFLLVGFVACAAFLLNQWNFKSKNATQIMMLLMVALALYGTVMNGVSLWAMHIR